LEFGDVGHILHPGCLLSLINSVKALIFRLKELKSITIPESESD